MSGGSYQTGDLVTFWAMWSLNGVLTDPGGVSFQVKDPNNLITTYTYGSNGNVQRDDAGVYTCKVTVGISGLWWYRAQGTGIVQKNAEASFTVGPSQFGS